jgi:hypothetical protein
MHNLGAWGYFVELIIGPWGEASQWQGLAPLFADGTGSLKNTQEHGPWENYAPQPEAPCTPAGWFLAVAGEDYAEAGALSEFEAAVLEEVIAEVDSAEFLADLLVFEPDKPDPRICTEACWAAAGFDRFLHGPH